MLIHAIVFAVALVANLAQGQQVCNSNNCVPPACRCASTTPPGNLPLADVPQFVFLSFDGAITTTNVNNYTALFSNKYNPDGCQFSFTFFVYHTYNDYNLTHHLYYKGQEIASHTISHALPAEGWKTKTVSEWEAEVGGMRSTIARFANIPENSIVGARAPYLQTSGDATMQAVKKLGMYDSSYSTKDASPTPIWPYTLDHGFQHDCTQEPCPTSAFPGVWTVPMISLIDKNNRTCALVDGCLKPNTTSEAVAFLKDNFNRHYTSTKAPFGLYMNANAWFQQTPYLFDAYNQFLQYLGSLPDVYVVSISQGLQWMKNPVKLSQISNVLKCPPMYPSSCLPRSCYYDGDSTPDGSEQYMKSCVTCPNVYPWVGNPLGQ